MQRHRCIARLLHIGQRRIDGVVGRVGLGRRGQIDGGLSQWDAPFRPTDLGHGVESGIGQQQGVGIGQTDIFGGTDHEAACDELGVFAAGDHARQPIDGRIGIAAADALDESRNDVVVHLPFLVVGHGVLLQALGDAGIVDNDGALGGGIGEQVDDVEQFARVATGKAQQGVGFAHFKFALTQHHVVVEGVVEQLEQVGLAERFEHVDLTTGEQRANHFERGVLGRGADQGDIARLDGRQQRILLRLGKTMDFVDEKNGRHCAEKLPALGLGYDLAHLLHSTRDGTEGEKGGFQLCRDDLGQSGFAHARRSPQDEGRDASAGNHVAQHGAGADQVLLADIGVERKRAQTFCQRFHVRVVTWGSTSVRPIPTVRASASTSRRVPRRAAASAWNGR